MKNIEIKMWGTVVGRAYLNDDNICVFQYDKNFIDSKIEISPIVMPLDNKPYSFMLSDTFKGLPGLLADSLPDKFGNAVIDAWLKREGRDMNSFSVLDRLCYIGTRGMGALEYYPIIKDINNTSEVIEVEHMVELCNEILAKRENMLVNENNDYINQLIKVSSSAGGARAKAIVAYNKEKGIFKSGQVDAGKGYEYCLIKFGNVANNADKEEADSDYHTRVEYAYYLLAGYAGINMSESTLIHNNGYHFMTKRFDRYIDKNGNMQKLHVQSLGGLAHFDFNVPGIISYESVAPIMRMLKLSFSEIEQFYRRMAFNVIFRNQDDHVKNIEFLMDKSGKWSLSPAYDVTFAYNPNGIWTSQHQMTINGKKKDITKFDIYAAGERMGIHPIKVQNILREVERAKDKWMECAEKAFIPEIIAREIENQFEKVV